jgi:omega-amidase
MVKVGLCLAPALPLPARISKALIGSDFLVFPELVDSGYAGLGAGMPPHRAGSPLLGLFAQLSRDTASYCVAGSVAFSGSPSLVTNTSFVFHRGRIRHRYDKIHLFRPVNDHRYFRQGTRIGTFTAQVSGGRLRCGVVLCYDLRFPELIRAMALKGLEVLFVPARWPLERDQAWQTLLRARAIENQIFVVGCNALGREGGHSYVYGPSGEVLFSSRRSPARRMHVVRLDIRLLARARRFHRNLMDAVILHRSTLPRGFNRP